MKGKYLIPALAAGLFAVSFFTAASAEEETISQGVYIGSVDVSGMTAQEAETAVNQAIEQSVGEGFTVRIGDETATATAQDFGLTWENTEVVEEAMALGKSGNIIKRYKDTKDLENHTTTFELTYEPDESLVADFVERMAQTYDREATDGSLYRDSNGNFVIEGGVVGIVVDQDASVQAILDYLDSTGGASDGEIVLEVTEDVPRGTQEELSQVQDLLGTATTYYGSTYERNTNVEVGASKLNGHIIYPGETFSVTAAVIPFTAENGYMLAPSYESGSVVDSYGGGICQVSTTLYNAVLDAELEVVERHNHSMTVSYVEASKDAAIAEGLLDFQFSNNTDAPIYIEGWAGGGQLTFNIFGKEYRPSDRYVEYISEILSTTTDTSVKLVADYENNVGYLEQTQSAMEGVEAVLWKQVTYNGETTTEQVNSSHYQATPATYDVGVNSTDPNLTNAMLQAIATGSLEAVQNVINNGVTTEPTTEAPATEAPATEAPATEAPATEAPATEAPATEAPATEAPATEAPATEAPATEAPATEPVTEAPATEAPADPAEDVVVIGDGEELLDENGNYIGE
ncbi:MAG TPA: VanW family protein [Candidatus Limivivens intestinipullorum]|uniref:VanW family protein n=1 Tax=Candidatus Limivivens intestinipullorum TaxID=2840858 RepID=A0A9D1ERN3_9FIRM|nr:VanW family protein [Candidatus Limivivens intestinipullorum]